MNAKVQLFRNSSEELLDVARKVTVHAAKNIMSKVKKKVSRQTFDLEEAQSLASDNLVLRAPVTEQICRVSGASLSIYTYTLKYARIQELFSHLFCDRDYPASQLIYK